MQSGGMGGGNNGKMGGMNSSWENQGGRGNGNNFGNNGPVWSRGSNIENDNMGDMMGAGFSTGMGGFDCYPPRGENIFNWGKIHPGPQRSEPTLGNFLLSLSNQC